MKKFFLSTKIVANQYMSKRQNADFLPRTGVVEDDVVLVFNENCPHSDRSSPIALHVARIHLEWISFV